jgi:cytochrome c oxidase cbb3-type subunit III
MKIINLFTYQDLLANGMLLLAAVVIIAAFGVLLHLLNTMVKIQELRIMAEKGIIPEAKKKESQPFSLSDFINKQYKSWTNVVPIEREKDVMLDHDYDGIRELDNSLPPWWKALFYITIVFGLVYMVYYHWGGNGPSSAQEYEMQMASAQEEVKAYRASLGQELDENNVVAVTDPGELDLGKTLYNTHCVACHGLQGEGGVGPNFADEYWIHGGGVKNVFRIIKYGVVEKGMISWQNQLRATDMQKIASYILTFQGTNPPNGKEPQGEIYVEEAQQQ